MKLTNMDRDAFVKAVMNDVPQVDYSEKAHAIIREAHKKWLPEKVLAVHQDGSLRDKFLDKTYFYPARGLDSLTIYGGSGFSLDSVKGLKEKVEKLAEPQRSQNEKRENLRRQIKSAIYGVNTLKQALDVMPEFAKYLPANRDGKIIRDVPCVANLVTDLAAAGWPKGEKTK